MDHALSKDGTTKALAAMLLACPSVEDLALCFIKDYEEHGCNEPIAYIPLLKMLGLNKLSKLRKLDVANCRMEEDQLVGTLLLCASTLQDLSLDDIVLDRGTWACALDKLKAKVQLSSADIGDLFGIGSEMHDAMDCYGYPGEDVYGSEICIGDAETTDWLNGEDRVNPVRRRWLQLAGMSEESVKSRDCDPDVCC